MKEILLIFTLLSVSLQAQTALFNTLLQKHVTNDGLVNYQGLQKDKAQLENYLDYLEKTTPSNSWSTNKKKAFYMNAYNAYMLYKVLEEYPIKSVLKINKKGKNAWNIPFAIIGGNEYTLDDIEHEILRKTLFDPRIHVGVNCAATSCPKLVNFAFTEDNINEALDQLMKEFINDTTKNEITENKVKLSQIFNWYKDDFTKEGSLIDYINQYANVTIKPKAKIRYLEYNWTLNEK